MSFTHDLSQLNPCALDAQYAVRGRIALEADDLKRRLSQGEEFPFTEVVQCNIGNPQALQQQPLDYFRDLLALVNTPRLLESDDAKAAFQPDMIATANEILSHITTNTGAYSHSKGLGFIRETVASFLEERSGFPANPDHIFLADGASPAIQALLQVIIRDRKDAILLPIPQYPLYSASVTLCNGTYIPYYLIEEENWGIGESLGPIYEAYDKAIADGYNVRAIVTINPGNPTGQILSRSAQEQLVQFCAEKDIILLADEVYQENIYIGEWYPFRQVLMESPHKDAVKLASFHSTSKGFFGECGRRGGFGEYINFPESFLEIIYKLASMRLCPNVDGQLAVNIMLSPPKEGDASFPHFDEQRTALIESYKRRAARITEFWNSLPGVTCQPVMGAMYSFPNIVMPQKAIEAAEAESVSPDMFYCLKLLQATGICTVPGAGFKQVPGTYHLRCTILPREDIFEDFLGRIRSFHEAFLAQYQ